LQLVFHFSLLFDQADDSDFASSDDNIPLKQILIDKKPNHEDKDDIEEVYDSGDYFKPYNDDCNSGDSNLSFPVLIPFLSYFSSIFLT
jgi:hypothetical protein